MNSYSGSIFSNSTNTISSGSCNSCWSYPSSTITIAGSYFNISQPKVKYTIMGEEIEVDGNYTYEISSFLSLITVNGWRYYEEMLKNGIYLTGDLKSHLERMYIHHQRDQKIKDILETKTEE